MKIFAIIGLILLTACNPIKSKLDIKLGKAIPAAPVVAPAPVPLPLTTTSGFKVTTGAGAMAGSNVSARAAILPNDRKLVGGNISGTFSISKDQVR